MIDYKTYNPADDAIESESHLCEKLSSEIIELRQKAELVNSTQMDIPFDAETLDKIADCMERAQLTISYLQGLVMGQQVAMDNLKVMCKALASNLDKEALDGVFNGFVATPMESDKLETNDETATRIYFSGKVEDRIQ